MAKFAFQLTRNGLDRAQSNMRRDALVAAACKWTAECFVTKRFGRDCLPGKSGH